MRLSGDVTPESVTKFRASQDIRSVGIVWVTSQPNNATGASEHLRDLSKARHFA